MKLCDILSIFIFQLLKEAEDWNEKYVRLYEMIKAKIIMNFILNEHPVEWKISFYKLNHLYQVGFSYIIIIGRTQKKVDFLQYICHLTIITVQQRFIVTYVKNDLPTLLVISSI